MGSEARLGDGRDGLPRGKASKKEGALELVLGEEGEGGDKLRGGGRQGGERKKGKRKGRW